MLFAFPVEIVSIAKALLCHLPYQAVIISIISLNIYCEGDANKIRPTLRCIIYYRQKYKNILYK
jgi:hypothetical protein